MTPSNPTNSQPLIYRIADKLGVFHLVAPVNHTHAQSEVEGLTDALAAKANAVAAGSPTGGIIIANTAGELLRSSKTVTDLENAIAAKMDNKTIDSTPTANSTNLVTSGGVKAALDGKAAALHGHTSIQDEADTQSASVIASGDTVNIEVQNEGGGGECEIKPSNIGNLIRALSDPDSTPTANSTNLVTSGGVKAALDGKANKVDVEYQVFDKGDASEHLNLDTIFNDGHNISHFILTNYVGEEIKVSECFYTQYGELIENGQTLSADSTAIVKIVHYNNGSTHKFFMVVEEIYEA